MLLRHDWVIFAEQEGMILIGLVAEENFETSLLLLFLVDRKLRRFYILITAELLLIQNNKSSGL